MFPFSYLSDFARGEVPNLDEAVHRAGDQILTVRGEAGTLYVGFLSKLWRRKKKKRGHVTTFSGFI